MLSKEVFNKSTAKLVTEYGSKGFEMPKERATQWYEFMKEYDDESFINAIDDCLKENSFAPSMSDIIKYYKHSSRYDGVKL